MLGDSGRDDDFNLEVVELSDVAWALALRAFPFDGKKRVVVSPDLQTGEQMNCNHAEHHARPPYERDADRIPEPPDAFA